jgi:hypothetical protein
VNSAFPSGGFCFPVERFVGVLSLFCLPVAGEWIVGRGEFPQCGEGWKAGGNGDGSAWNGGQGISNLLFICRSSLAFNAESVQLPSNDSGMALELGSGRSFQAGGEGVAGDALPRSLQSITAVKIYQHCHRPFGGLKKQKKGGGHG